MTDKRSSTAFTTNSYLIIVILIGIGLIFIISAMEVRVISTILVKVKAIFIAKTVMITAQYGPLLLCCSIHSVTRVLGYTVIRSRESPSNRARTENWTRERGTAGQHALSFSLREENIKNISRYIQVPVAMYAYTSMMVEFDAIP